MFISPGTKRSAISGYRQSGSQLKISPDMVMCCHTETDGAAQSYNLTLSRYTYFGSVSTSTDPICQVLSRVAARMPNLKATGIAFLGMNFALTHLRQIICHKTIEMVY